MEIELGRGVHDIGETAPLSPDGAAEREYLPWLLDRCDELDVQITFTVIGNLQKEDCRGTYDGPHEEGVRERSGHRRRPRAAFLIPGLAPEIASRSTDHERCPHTDSHGCSGAASAETVGGNWRPPSVGSRISRASAHARSFHRGTLDQRGPCSARDRPATWHRER